MPAKSTEPSRKEWANRISTAWTKCAAAFIETGRTLIEARDSLNHGEFLEMVETELPFGPRMAEMLMAVARHKFLSNSQHIATLPPHVTTLYELTRLPDRTLRAKLRDGSITPELECDAVKAWRRPVSQVVVTTEETVVRGRPIHVTTEEIVVRASAYRHEAEAGRPAIHPALPTEPPTTIEGEPDPSRVIDECVAGVQGRIQIALAALTDEDDHAVLFEKLRAALTEMEEVSGGREKAAA
jgi:hypothetical protein